MIVLSLSCAFGHKFDGWFASVSAYDTQLGAGQLTCPTCGGKEISRLPSVPHLRRTEAADVVPESPAMPAAGVKAIVELVKTLAANAENVGERFAEEARRIHYQEAPERSIRGRATPEQSQELAEEGIAVLPLPFIPPEDLH